MNFKEELIQLLTAETGLAKDEVSILLAVPPDPRLGDYAFPCFKLGENAPQEAGKLQEKLKLPTFLRKAEVSGPYLNFFLNQRVLAEETLNAIYKQAKNYGKEKAQANESLLNTAVQIPTSLCISAMSAIWL